MQTLHYINTFRNACNKIPFTYESWTWNMISSFCWSSTVTYWHNTFSTIKATFVLLHTSSIYIQWSVKEHFFLRAQRRVVTRKTKLVATAFGITTIYQSGNPLVIMAVLKGLWWMSGLCREGHIHIPPSWSSYDQSAGHSGIHTWWEKGYIMRVNHQGPPQYTQQSARHPVNQAKPISRHMGGVKWKVWEDLAIVISSDHVPTNLGFWTSNNM